MTQPNYMQMARDLVGLKEIVGTEHEARVVEFFAEAGHAWVKDDETSWCAAFANAMLQRDGYKGTGKLTARSFLDWGQRINIDDAKTGDVVVIPRGNSSWQGHVFFFVRWIDVDTMEGLGGNQKNSVSLQNFKKKGVLGVRRPSERLPVGAVSVEGFLRMGMLNSERVRSMQRVLKGLGYAVGTPDGDYGNITRDAVLAWKADNDLPLSPDVSPSDLDRMESSAPRPLSEARSTATTAEVKAVDGSVRNDDRALKVAVGAATSIAIPTIADNTGALDSLEQASETAGKANGLVEQVVDGGRTLGIDVAAFVSSHSTLLLICGLAVVGYFIWKSMRAKVEDHREGRKL